MNCNRFLQTTALVLVLGPWAHVPAAAQAIQPVDVPAQALPDAITELGSETGLQIAANRLALTGKRSQAVSGSMTPVEALQRMLAGTSLGVRLVGDNSVLVTQNGNAIAALGDEELVGDDIVVQGELQTRTLQEAQTSVSVATGDELERRGDQSVYDFVERAPNVSQIGGRRGFSIRGINQSGFDGSTEPLISVQVDGIALPQSAINTVLLPTWDLEQVEVLRGPQSTQQGRNALAGAVIIRSRDPIYENEYRGRVGLATDEFFEGAFSVNQVLWEDKVALRFSGELSRSNGFTENPTLGIDDAVPSDLDSARAKLRLNPTDDLEAVVSFSYQESDVGVLDLDDTLFPDQRVKTTDVDEFNRTEQSMAGLRLSYEITDGLRLEGETTYYWQEGSSLLDLDGTALDAAVNFGDGETTIFEQDLRLLFDGDWYSGVIGGFFSRSRIQFANDGRTSSLLSPIPLPPGVNIIATSDSDIKIRNLAVFGEVELDAGTFLPGLSFVIGGRYDREHREERNVTEFLLSPGPTPPFPGFGLNESRAEADFDAFVPKLGVTYEWRPGLTSSFTFQQGYRAGGSTGSFGSGLTEYDPEFTNNFEIALRGEFLDGALTANANAFYTMWKDQQVLRPGPFGVGSIIENAGESRLWGGEFAATYFPTDDLEVFGTFGYTQTEYVDYISGANDFTGNEFPGAPRVTASFGGVYSINDEWSVGVDASFTGKAFEGPENAPETRSDSRFLLNAQVTYETEVFLGGIYARNLLDNDYAEARFGSNPIQIRPGEPLTVGAFAQFEF
ncbi:MAG: TonB-dependent receptor [Pseudomonadota bacterium]